MLRHAQHPGEPRETVGQRAVRRTAASPRCQQQLMRDIHNIVRFGSAISIGQRRGDDYDAFAHFDCVRNEPGCRAVDDAHVDVGARNSLLRQRGKQWRRLVGYSTHLRLTVRDCISSGARDVHDHLYRRGAVGTGICAGRFQQGVRRGWGTAGLVGAVGYRYRRIARNSMSYTTNERAPHPAPISCASALEPAADGEEATPDVPEAVVPLPDVGGVGG